MQEEFALSRNYEEWVLYFRHYKTYCEMLVGGGTAGGVEVVGGDAAGGKADAKTGFAHQQNAMGCLLYTSRCV